jgi:hypothetical protein
MTTTTITLGPADRVRLREAGRLLAELTERHDPELCTCPLCKARDFCDFTTDGWRVKGVRLAEAH